jgi:hypothetical protein
VNALGTFEPDVQPLLRIGAKVAHLAWYLAQRAPQDRALAAQHALEAFCAASRGHHHRRAGAMSCPRVIFRAMPEVAPEI